MMKFFIIAFVTIFWPFTCQLVSGQRTARVECYNNGNDYSMIFTVTKNGDTGVNFVYGLNATDGKLVNCASDADPAPSFFFITPTEFKVIINVTQAFAADADCGHTNTDAEFQWRFLTTQFPELIVKSMDILYVAPCNFSDATSTQTSTSVAVTGEPLENLTPDESITFDLQVVKDGALTASVGLGDKVNLKLTQTGGRDVTVTGHSCQASPDGVFDNTGEFDLIDGNGCPVNDYAAAGFTGGLRESTLGLFEQFQFLGQPDVYYQCTVRYCFAGDATCDGLPTCPPVVRRKRQATDESKASTSVRITINPHYTTGAQGQDCPPAGLATIPREESCLDNVGVISAFAVLGGLLLVTIAVSVCLYARSLRLINNPEKQKL